jgi:hypothetical protein
MQATLDRPARSNVTVCLLVLKIDVVKCREMSIGDDTVEIVGGPTVLDQRT